jgi:hypothetical protein
MIPTWEWTEGEVHKVVLTDCGVFSDLILDPDLYR